MIGARASGYLIARRWCAAIEGFMGAMGAMGAMGSTGAMEPTGPVAADVIDVTGKLVVWAEYDPARAPFQRQVEIRKSVEILFNLETAVGRGEAGISHHMWCAC